MNQENEIIQGSTPSRLVNDTPNWVRIVGLVGMVMVLGGLLMYAYNMWVFSTYDPTASFSAKDPTAALKDPKTRYYPLAIPFFVVGLLCMLFQAGRERDKSQRRLLGIIGICFFSLGVLFTTHVLVSEAVQTWLSTGEGANVESASSKGKWAGLAATLVMALVILIAWVAPFVRSVSEGKVSLLGFGSAWIQQMGKPLVSATTLFGFIGVGVLAVIAFFLKDPLSLYADKGLQYSQDNRVPYGLGSYALLLMFIGLPFMLIFANAEEDEGWAKTPTSILGIVGIIAAILGMLGFITDLLKVPDFLLPYGFVLSLLGLIYIVLYISQRDDTSASAITLARWTGFLGLIVLVIAAFRSLLPVIFENSWLQEQFPSLEEKNFTSYLVPNGFLYMVLGGLYLLAGRLFSSESKLLIMTRRELSSFFTSPIGYIIMGATVIVASLVFIDWVGNLDDASRAGAALAEPVVASYFFRLLIVIYILIAIPMLTMRLMSEDNRSGTIEVMLTAPLDEVSIVLSKFLAGWLYVVFIFLIWAILLRIAGQEAFDYRPIISVLFGLAMISFGFVAMGLFFSSITKNQVVALLLTFAGMMGMFMLYFVEDAISRGRGGDPNSALSEFLRSISFVHHMFYAFANGKVEWKYVLFHLSFGAFWLFLTIRVLESRKWR
jgi:ABC-2 type transport system permease protein